MSDYQWCFENPRDAADLIEQQTAEIEALKAHVEQLYAALRHLHHNAKASGAEMGLALDVAEEALESTPQQNLSERDAEVARKAILAAAEDYRKEYMGQGVERLLTEFADVYAKRIKDGER